MCQLHLGLFNFRIGGEHALENSHRDRVPEVVLQQQAPLARIRQVGGFDRHGRDIGTDPQLRLDDDAVVGDLKTLERLGQPRVDRLGEREAIGLGVEDGQAVDGRIAVVGIDVQADEHPGTRRVRAVPSLRDLDVLIAAPRQHHLDALALQQRAQPHGEVERDVLLHDGADHDTRIPELGGVAGRAAAVSRVDRDHVG